MDKLQAAVNRLRNVLVWRPGYTNGPRVYEPLATEPATIATFKESVTQRSIGTLDLGNAALNGHYISQAPGFDASIFDQIEQQLADDPERDAFYELARAAEAVVQELRRIHPVSTPLA